MTYWPATVGPYLWHEFDSATVSADLHAIAASGLQLVRVHLLWDAFMPTPRGVPPQRLRDLERLLTAAEEEGLRVVPVLFAQSLGRTIMLPTYAIDAAARRPGVRVVSDAVTQPGAPRDQYTDPLMQETGLRWIETLLDAFAGHSALHAWDLGHDPATTMRPRRIADVQQWVAMMSARVREREQRCMLTIGSDDILTARGMRLASFAASLDILALAARDGGFPFAAPDDGRAGVFMAQLTLRLADGHSTLATTVDAPAVNADAEVPAGAARVESHVGDTVSGLVASGVSSLFARAWTNAGPRSMGAPPFDREPQLGLRGVVDTVGVATAFGHAWRTHARQGMERQPLSASPEQIDIEDYYANLPESVNDLYAHWKVVQGDRPGMLD